MKLPSPESLPAFTRIFPNEDACDDYLYDLRLKWTPSLGPLSGVRYLRSGRRVGACCLHMGVAPSNTWCGRSVL
jgi:hypothetical protein